MLSEDSSIRRTPSPPTVSPSGIDPKEQNVDPHATKESVEPDPHATRVPVEPVSPRPGRQPLPCAFGEYELLSEIARGGMGVVYSARQRVGDGERLVALKMILGGRLSSADTVDRFLREARAASTLDHPNIVPIYDVGEVNGQHYFSMPLLTGGSLADRLREGPLPPTVAAQLTRQIAEAIHHAHERGIIHRDLKPGNILLQDATPASAEGASGPVRGGSGSQSDRLMPKVADFGLARIRESDLSLTGEAMGTPSYMPPEQARGEKNKIGPASDVYSLGAILYCLVTGRPPFQATDPFETMRLVCESDPLSPRELNPQVPKDLETVCLKCLEKEPSRRYASAWEFAEELARFERGESVRARPVSSLERGYRWCKRNRTVAILLGALILVLSSGIGVSAWFAEDARKEASAARKAEEAEQKRANAEAAANQKAQHEKRLADEAKALATKQRDRAERLVYASKLALAQSAFNEGDLDLAFQHLTDCRQEWRGLEHRLLWTQFRPKQSLVGNSSGAQGLCFSLDGKLIVTGSGPDSATVWDASTGQMSHTLQGHTKEVISVAFSPDGTQLVTGSRDTTAKVWEAKTGRQRRTLQGHKGPISGVVFSPEGQQILTSSYDGTAKLWDAKNGSLIRTFTGHENGLTCVSFSPDGQQFATGSADDTVKLWKKETGQILRTLAEHRNGVHTLCFSPDGKQVATGSGDRTARVWDTSTGRLRLTLKAHTRDILCISYSPDGQQLLTGSEDGTARLWDARTGKDLFALPGRRSGGVRSACFSPDGTRIATGTGDGTVKVWSAQNGRNAREFRQPGNFISSACFSPDGMYAVTGSWDQIAKIWNVETGSEVFSLRGHKQSIGGVAFSPDGQRVATASVDKTAIVWNARDGKQSLVLTGHTGAVNSVCFSSTGALLATGSSDGTVRLWNSETGKETRRFHYEQKPIATVCFSPDGTYLAAGTDGNSVIVWDLENGDRKLTLEEEDTVKAEAIVCFAPNSKQLLAATDQQARLWSLETKTEILTLTGHTAKVASMCFSPDGKRILTGSADKTLKIWDSETGQELLTFKQHKDVIRSLAVSPDQKRLLTSAYDVATVWDIDKTQEFVNFAGHLDVVLCACLSPDGQRFLTGSADRTAKVWDRTTGKVLLTLREHMYSVGSVCYSADGKRIATGTGDKRWVIQQGKFDQSVRLWDAESGKFLRLLQGHKGFVYSLSFSPDGRYLLTCSDDKTVRLWDVEKGIELRILAENTEDILRVWFSGDGSTAYALSQTQKIGAWSVESGKSVDSANASPPELALTSQNDRSRYQVISGDQFNVLCYDNALQNKQNHWPLPDRAERLRYHAYQAALAEEQQQWFAVAFHLARFLLDDPANTPLKQRRERALAKDAADWEQNRPRVMEKAP